VGNLARPYGGFARLGFPPQFHCPIARRPRRRSPLLSMAIADGFPQDITFKIRRHNQPNAAHAQFWSELNRSRSNRNALSHSPGLRTGHSCRTNRAMAALSPSGEGQRRDVSLATAAAGGMAITMVGFVGVPAWRIATSFPMRWPNTARGAFVTSLLQS
jgi:hypothetical protein